VKNPATDIATITMCFLLVGPALGTGAEARKAADNRPNVVLIMADDLGYECLGCNGGTSYATPNLDRLAETGVRFTHCYVNPLCTPTRVALMTGRYNFRNYTQFGTLPETEFTFGHMMQDAGYVTCIVEKWQLDGKGGTRPDKAGFDEYYMKPGDAYNYADPYIRDNTWERVRHKGAYGPDLCVDYLCNFIERHKDEPFFAYYPMALTHFPFKPTPDSPAWNSGDRHEENWKKYFLDMVTYMDKIVGTLVGRLEELGIRDNTLILFLGDNGTDTRIASQFRGKSYRGGKGWLTDAGTHVPMIVNWPGVVKGGRVLDDLVDPTDLFMTIAEAAGSKPRRPPGDGVIDGVSLLPRLTGAKNPAQDWVLIELINEFRKFGKEQRPAFAGHEGRYVRNHRWKLYDTGKSRRNIPFYKGGQLYDIVNDPDEERPIAPDDNDPESVAARKDLQAVFDAHPWE
jgi:arylsulfatase A